MFKLIALIALIVGLALIQSLFHNTTLTIAVGLLTWSTGE